MLYTSIENKKIKQIKKLYQKKYRDLENSFIVEGEHLVIEAYKNGVLKELYLEQGKNINIDFEKKYISTNVLKYLSNLETSPGIIGVCKKIDKNEIGNKIVALDGIQDPGNLGTIIRSCVAFNIDTLIISNNTVDLYNDKTIRASQGMIFALNIIICDLDKKLVELKNKGYKILSTNVTSGKSLKNIEKSEKFVIIMGNEGNGVSNTLESICDDFLYIEINPKCESLNVGIATSIILYELDK
ncbi:MAG TPA: RNA methyltransferase [Tenericutes bacterium]|nr:RNA methyltransferase [Mycoplasmatota bacterium]